MRFIAPLIVLCLICPAWAEVVHLTDGSSLTGTVKRQGEGWLVTGPDGKVTYIGDDRVEEIDLSPKFANPNDVAADRLDGLRSATQNSGDVDNVVKRYQDFIAQFKNTPSVAEAEKDLAVWQDRKDRGLVHVGSKWVSKEEAGNISQESIGTAEQARNLIKTSHFKDAEPLIQQALADDPKNASAVYLQGILDFQAESIPAARHDFEAVDKLVPDHGPTLNNLAVILFRQNAAPAAMNYYNHAMQASPLNRQIISNVDELLNAVPPEQKTTPVAQRLIALFTAQETQLEQKMGDLGYFKWGATWVNKAQYDLLKAQDADIHKKLDQLSDDYDATQSKIDRIEREIDDNTRVMLRIDASSWAQDPTGAWVRTLPPKTYYDLDADNRMLTAEHAQEQARLESIRAQAKETQQSLPTPKYTGVQQLIGVEGTPLLTPMPGAGELPPPAPAPKVSDAPPSTQPAMNPVFEK